MKIDTPTPLWECFPPEEAVQKRNQILEASGLENHNIRLPGFNFCAHFYYKVVEDPHFRINAHAHEHWEITRISHGKVRYQRLESGSNPLEPKQEEYLVLPPHCVHSWQVVQVPVLMHSWQLSAVAMDEDGEAALTNLHDTVQKRDYILTSTSMQTQLETMLWNTLEKMDYPYLSGAILTGFWRLIFGEMMLETMPWPAHSITLQRNHTDMGQNLSRRIEAFIEANLHHPINLKDLESHFHYSSRHLNRIFHEQTGTSIGNFLRLKRMELARRWLTTTDRSIKDIAYSLGYSGVSQFCRYFQQSESKSPTEYRNYFYDKPAP